MSRTATHDALPWLKRILLGAGMGTVIGLLELFENFTLTSVVAACAAGATFGACLGATIGALKSRAATYAICGCAGGLAGVVWTLIRQPSCSFALPVVVGLILGLLFAFGELVGDRRQAA